MKQFFTLFILLGFIHKSQAQMGDTLAPRLDDIINSTIEQNDIPGMSVAVIKEGKLIYNKNHGMANLEHEVPLSDKSIFRVYSITKIFISVAVFKLWEEGKISLDQPIGKYDIELPDSWKDRQVIHLLTHSTGFPDMAPVPLFQDLTEGEAWEKIINQPLAFDSGSQYQYNQTNFVILQKIIEQITQQSVAQYVLQSQFNSQESVFFSGDSRTIVKHRVTPYFPFATGNIMIDHSYLQGDYFQACNGLNITMNAFLAWDKRLKNNELLKESTMSKMWDVYSYTDSDKVFAIGWDKRPLNGHSSYGFSGSLVTAYRIFPEDDLSVIALGNGLGKFFDIEDLMNELAKAIDPDIYDVGKKLEEDLYQAIKNEGNQVYNELFLELNSSEKNNEVNLESIGNTIGYMLIREQHLAKAIAVFKLNTTVFPESWNVYDSLGEAYMLAGDKQKSIAAYQHSLTLNPENEYGKAALKKLGAD